MKLIPTAMLALAAVSMPVAAFAATPAHAVKAAKPAKAHKVKAKKVALTTHTAKPRT